MIYFFVEEVTVKKKRSKAGYYHSIIINHSPEPTPVKIIDYYPDNEILPHQVEAFELMGFEKRTVNRKNSYTFLSYNEERVLFPLYKTEFPVFLRNPMFLELYKEQE